MEALARGEALAALLAADPAAGAVVDVANPRRVARALEVYRLTGLTPAVRAASAAAAAVRAYRPLLAVVAVGADPGEALRRRVEARFDAMLAAGLLAEVRRLALHLRPTAAQAVGLRGAVAGGAGRGDAGGRPQPGGRSDLGAGRAAAHLLPARSPHPLAGVG